MFDGNQGKSRQGYIYSVQINLTGFALRKIGSALEVVKRVLLAECDVEDLLFRFHSVIYFYLLWIGEKNWVSNGLEPERPSPNQDMIACSSNVNLNT
jgi:hypothetical protein